MYIKQIEIALDWVSFTCHDDLEEQPLGDFWQLVTLSLLLFSKDCIQIYT